MKNLRRSACVKPVDKLHVRMCMQNANSDELFHC